MLPAHELVRVDQLQERGQKMTTVKIDGLGCVFRWSKKYKQLEWTPLSTDGSFDFDEGGTVDEEIVGGEIVVYKGKERTLSEVYRDVEKRLGVAK